MVHSAVHGTDLVKPNEAYAGDGFDYCYVKDCATALTLLQTAGNLKDRIYNIGAGRATTIGEVLDAARQIKPDLKIELQAGSRPGLGPDHYMSIDAISRDTGYKPKFDIRQGVADYATWLRTNEF